jgi:hypothetical protein
MLSFCGWCFYARFVVFTAVFLKMNTLKSLKFRTIGLQKSVGMLGVKEPHNHKSCGMCVTRALCHIKPMKESSFCSAFL